MYVVWRKTLQACPNKNDNIFSHKKSILLLLDWKLQAAEPTSCFLDALFSAWGCGRSSVDIG